MTPEDFTRCPDCGRLHDENTYCRLREQNRHTCRIFRKVVTL